jgi:DNA-binding NarL/FixJ family response regulator
MKVLIADGSPMVAGRLMNALQEIPEVEALAYTSDARTTLESIRANKPEILIADTRIAGSHGLPLFQTIRRERPAMILIVLSDTGYPQSKRHYEAAGVDLIMDKSNDFTELFEFVRRLVESPTTPGDKSRDNGIRERFASEKLKAGLQLVLLAFSTSCRFIGF